MEIVRPAPVNDTTLISSNISDTFDYALWSSGTTYAVNAIVVGTNHHEYQSLQAANIGHSLSDPLWWLDLGFDRRWRMFDQSNSSQSSYATTIDVSILVSGRANAVSLLNIAADTVQIIATTVASGEVYNKTFNLTSDSGINNWFDYFFEPIVRKGDLVVTDLPTNGDPTIRVIVTATGSTVRIGTLVVGQSLYIGATIYGAKIGMNDYSRKVVDAFGNYTIVQRAFAKTADFKVWLDSAKVDATAAFLPTIRAIPCVYKGTDQYAGTYIYGFFKTWSVEITSPNKSYCLLTIEGLT